MSFDWATGECVLQEEQHCKVKGHVGTETGRNRGASALAPGPSRCPWRAASQSPRHSLELMSGMGATRGLDGEASLCPPCPLSSVTQKGSQCKAPGGLLPPNSRHPVLAGACFLHYVTRQV